MAYRATRNTNVNPPLDDFTCDTRADLADIPLDNVLWGSSAFVIADSSVWILDSTKTWKEI
jgi:hypothetical protein